MWQLCDCISLLLKEMVTEISLMYNFAGPPVPQSVQDPLAKARRNLSCYPFKLYQPAKSLILPEHKATACGYEDAFSALSHHCKAVWVL